MKVAKLYDYVGEEPIWKYEWEEGTFLVRVRAKDPNGINEYIIENEDGKLYSFHDYSGNEEKAIWEIINGEAECEKRKCYLDSIYD